jgi:hypothetical protein
MPPNIQNFTQRLLCAGFESKHEHLMSVQIGHPAPSIRHLRCPPNNRIYLYCYLISWCFTWNIDVGMKIRMDRYHHSVQSSYYQEEKKECDISDSVSLIEAEANAEFLAVEALRIALEARRAAVRLAEMRGRRERQRQSAIAV